MNKLLLYHYSNVNIKDTLKIEYSFKNSYSLNDKKACNINRLFFSIDKEIKEYRFKNCLYRYTVEINKDLLYDLRIDPLNLIDNLKSVFSIVYHIKGLGYKGIIYNSGYNIVNLFYDIMFIKKEKLR